MGKILVGLILNVNSPAACQFNSSTNLPLQNKNISQAIYN